MQRLSPDLAFMYGGVHPAGVYGDLWQLNVRTYQWKRISEMLALGARYSFQNTVMGARWLILGGVTWDNTTSDADGLVFG